MAKSVLLLAAALMGACGQAPGRPTPEVLTSSGPPVTPDVSGVTVPSGTLVFQDDFSDLGSGWEVFAEPQASAAYVEGEYWLKLNQAPLRAWGVLRNVTTPADVAISVTGRLASGPSSAGYGVMCRFADEDHYYFFVLTGAGDFIIGKHSGEVFVGLSAPQAQPSPAILPGNAPNLITAQCLGDRLRLSINAAPIAEVRDTEFSSGRVGLLAIAERGNGAEARFDNLTIYTPQ